MPAPQPLTHADAPHLDWSQPDTPAAKDFGDIYFSTDGGLDEARTVFLKGCGLPKRWEERQVFTIAELGFGSGLNFLASWQMWRETALPDQRLHYISIEKFPFDAAQLARALSIWPELSDVSGQLVRIWPGRVKGFHRLDFGAVSLTLIHDDVATALDAVSGLRADAWFLDGFSPGKNPAMWSADVLNRIGQLCAVDARLATFSVAGHVRAALTDAGFDVTKAPGFGRKRHRLEARHVGASPIRSSEIGKVLIVGSGIAGRSLAHALKRRGVNFDLIDDHRHPAASDNPAALVKPRLDLQDRPESRFFLSAYLHALRNYASESILSRGVRQIPKTPAQATRYKKIAAQRPLGEGHMRWVEGVLDIDSALVVDPQTVLGAFDIRHISMKDALEKNEYSHILIAAGYAIRELAPELEMRFSRGQLSWAQGGQDAPIAYGGYALPLDGEILIGATHDRVDARDPFAAKAEDDQTNLENYAAIAGGEIPASARASRASVRVTSHNTLPVMARLGETRWALTGLGSRGFTFAPLLAEALICEICGEVSPLERAVLDRFVKQPSIAPVDLDLA